MNIIVKRMVVLLPLVLLLVFTSTKADVVHIEDNKYYQDAVFAEIKSEEDYAAGLTTDGRLFVVGENAYGRLGTGDTSNRDYPTDITGNFGLASNEYITMFDTGYYHMIAATNTNRVFVWGWNNNRQLGDGTTTQRNIPTETTSLFSFAVGENILDVEASLSNGYVLTSTGRYFSWGANFGGSVGNNSTALVSTVTDHTAFLTLEAGEILVDIQSNDYTVLAMSNIGNLYGWGSNFSGALFLGDETNRLTNTLLNGAFALDVDEYITAFSSGDDFSVVATSKGEVYSAGSNSIGQLGDGTGINRNTPTLISGQMSFGVGEYVTHIDNYGHTIIATNENRVFGWGWNKSECIGDAIGTYVYLPYEISSLLNIDVGDEITGVSASGGNSYVYTNNNDFYSWGSNGYGKFMFDFGVTYSSAIPIKGPKNFDILSIQEYLGSNVAMISTNHRHTVIKTEDEKIYVWGYNYYGSLGTGDKVNRITPFEITDTLNLEVAETVTMIATADRHTVYLTSDYRVIVAGNNQYGMLGTGDYGDRLNPYDTTPNLPLNPTEYIVKVYAGGFQTFLLSNEGNVFAMGRSIEGQLTLSSSYNSTPTNITSNLALDPGESVMEIYVGYRHTLVHTSNDRLLAFGDNVYGQLGDGTNTSSQIPKEVNLDNCFDTSLSNILDIGIGYNHNIVLSDNNDVCAWGLNESGELGEGGSVNRNAPYQINNQFVVDINESFTDVSVGNNHNFILTDYGNTHSWGDGYSGMLATGDSFDKKFPEDVSANINIGSDTMKEYSLGAFFSYVLTEEGSLYGVGSNSSGFLGLGLISATSTFRNVTKGIDDLHTIKFLSLPEQYVGCTKVYLKIYPEYNIFDDIVSIRVNGIDRDLTFLEEENGEITFSLVHSYLLGETVTMIVNGITYEDGYVAATGQTTAETVMILDNEDPTFDVASSLTIPVGTVEPDWTTFVNNLDDNSYGPITLGSTDDVNTNIVGDYTVYVTATDESGNSLEQSFPVYIVDNFSPVITYTGQTTFEAGSAYNLLIGLSATDNYDGDITGDVMITDGMNIDSVGDYQVEFFVSDSSGNTDTLLVDVEVVDTTPPTFDDPPDIGPYAIGVLSDENWTSQIVNVVDNSTDTITMGFTDDIDYAMPGIYTVSIWAEDVSGNRTTKQFSIELVDETAPEISELQVINIGLGESIDIALFFTAIDLVDGNVTSSIILDDTAVNYYLVGMYSMIVYAYDLSMNEQQITVEVYIHDLVGPSFDVVEEMVFELGQETEYDWLTLVTNLLDDSGDTPDLTISHNDVDFTTVGIFSVGIRATDEAGNYTEEFISVTIEDTTPPVLDPIDDFDINQEVMGITLDDITPNATDESMQVVYGLEAPIVYGTVGNYIVTVTATDPSGNSTSVTFIVSVIDNTPPEFELNGDAIITIELGEAYAEQGATCLEANCTVSIDTSNIPEDNETGEFIVWYQATDEFGNTSMLSRTIIIEDTMPPELALEPGIDTIFVGDEYTDGGIIVDEIDDYIITVDSTVDIDNPGVYTITYLVVDESLNETDIIRYVNVVEKNPEVEFELGPGFTSLDIGDTFNTPACVFRFDGNPVPCVFDILGIDTSVAGTYTFSAEATYHGDTQRRDVTVWVWDFDDNTPPPEGYWKKEEEVLL